MMLMASDEAFICYLLMPEVPKRCSGLMVLFFSVTCTHVHVSELLTYPNTLRNNRVWITKSVHIGMHTQHSIAHRIHVHVITFNNTVVFDEKART